MQSRNAYFFGSFVIPEGAGPGDPRLEFDAENGAIRIYDSVGTLVASMAATSGTDGTYVWIPGITSYSSTLTAIRACLDSAGSLAFSAPASNDPFFDDGIVAAGNPGTVNVADRASLRVGAPSTFNGAGINDGRAELLLESTSADGVNKGRIWYQFDADVAQVCQHIMQGYLYAGRWDAGGTTVNPEVWNPITLPGGWGTFQTCSYRLNADGFVHLRGIASAPGPIAFGTVITTLPVGYRPAQVEYKCVPYDGAAGIGRAIVRTTGAVELYDAASQVPDLGSIQFGVAGLL